VSTQEKMRVGFFSSTTTALLLLLAAATTTSIVSAQTVFNATGPMYDLCDVSDYYADFLAKSQNPVEWVMEDLALHLEATHRNTALPNIAEVRGDGTSIYI
jgi:hypothetical protein